MRALVIDDSKVMRKMITGILQECGLTTVEATNGGEGLERLRNTVGIGLALVDWKLPGMDGFEFVCEVRKDRAFDDVILMMVTSETNAKEIARALDAGANEYMMKPFTREGLREKLLILGVEA